MIVPPEDAFTVEEAKEVFASLTPRQRKLFEISLRGNVFLMCDELKNIIEHMESHVNDELIVMGN